MTALFYAVLKASFQGSIVILAVLALRLVLRKAPKSLFCLLWLLAGLRLALPFEIQSSLSLQPNYDFAAQNVLQTPDAETGREDILNDHGDVLVGIQTAPQSPAETPTLPGDSWENNQSEDILYGEEGGTVTALTLADIAAPIWLLGVACMAAASAVSYIRLKRRVRESCRIENGCFTCPGLDTAFVLGFLPPKIYLPAGLTEQEKTFIYDHENTHIARHDHWYKLLGYLVLSIHWFNPLVWVGYSLLCRDIELACDEHVVRNMSLAERKAYSAALLSCGSHTARLAACPVAFGESNPKKRILNVLNYKRPTFWITLLAVIAVVFVGVCLLTSPKNQEDAPEERLWNLEMAVSDVTPSGLTVRFIQHGPFLGGDRAKLMYGSHYTLEKWVDGTWEAVEMLPQEQEVGWTLLAYLIEVNSTKTISIDWEWLYGELPAGQYRIGKNVDLSPAIGDPESEMFWAEFTIGGSDFSQCLRVLEEIWSRDAVHILEQYSFSGDGLPEKGVDRNYFRSGDTWMRVDQYSGGKFSGNFSVKGSFYESVSPDENFLWQQVDAEEDMFPQPWLLTFAPDAAAAEVISRQEIDYGYALRLMVHAPVEMGWLQAEEYYVDFCFDHQNHFLRAVAHIAAGYSEMTVNMMAPDVGTESVLATLRQYAGNLELPEETAQKEVIQAQVDKCRKAMQELKSAEELFLYVSSLDGDYTPANVYMRASNGWLFQYRRLQWDYEYVSWLRLGNEQYIYGGDTDENGQMTAPYYWQTETQPESHDFQLPYPFDLDWEKIHLNYGGTEKENGMEIITVTFPDYLDVFEFSFYGNGELAYFTVGDTSGEPEATTTQFLVEFPYDGTVAQRLEQIYSEALAELNRKPEKPDDAYYAELFSRKTDGAYTDQWLHELYMTFYLDPEGFVSHLAHSDRAEEILTHMKYLVDFYAPYRFDQVVSQLEQSGNVDAQLLGILQTFTNRNVQTEQETGDLADQIAWLAKCATALESYQSRGSWSVSTVNSFSGRDATNLSSASVWYGIGNDYLVWTQIPDDAGTGNWWDLGTGGKTWHRYSYTPAEESEAWAEGSELEAWDSGWESGSTNAQEMTPPWPVWYQWVGGDIAFGEAGVHERTQYVVFTVQGSPYADDAAQIAEYEVRFLFSSSGELRNVRIRYSEEGADRQVEKNYLLNDAAQSDIRDRIDQAYREAAE